MKLFLCQQRHRTILKTLAQDVYWCFYSVTPDRNMLHVHYVVINYSRRPSPSLHITLKGPQRQYNERVNHSEKGRVGPGCQHLFTIRT